MLAEGTTVNQNYSVWPLGKAQLEDRQDWPGISIVTPNYNGARLLPATIESVLAQGYPKLQYAVLDGGSTDESQQIIEQYADRLHYWHSQADEGQYAAINEGFTKTSHEICGWLNSDDQYFPWTLHTVGAIFRDFPEVEWLSGIPCTMRCGIIHTYPSRGSGYCQQLIRAGCYGGGLLPVIQQESCFWRRSLWEKTGGLDLDYSLASDFDLWMRFAEHAPLVFSHILLGAFHQTGENRSVVHREDYSNEVDRCVSRVGPEMMAYRRKVRRYQQVAQLPLVRKAYRISSGLQRLNCPVLSKQNSVERQFELREVPLNF